MDLLHWVRDLLTSDTAAPARSSAAVAEADDDRQNLKRLEQVRRQVEAEVSRLLKARPAAMAGRVVRLSLEPIADRLGDRWPAAAARVRTAASAILGRRLGQTAVILPHGPLALIAVAPDRTPDMVLAAAAGAAAEITRFAFGGDDAGPWPTISVADGLKGEEPKFTGVQIDELLASLAAPDRARSSAEPPSTRIPVPPSSPPLAPIHAPLPDLRAIATETARAALGPLWQPMRDLDQPTPPPAETPAGDGSKPDESVQAHLDCDYRPVVSLVHGRVAAGMLRPKLKRSNAVLRGYAVLGPQADAVDIAQLDLYCLQRATADLTEAQRQGRGTFVTLSVHFETLAPTARRMVYAGRLAAAADQSGARIAPEIVGCPPDVAPSMLEAMVAPIRPHCRMVLMRIKLDHRRFEAATAAGIRRTGIHLGRHADAAARQAASLVTGSLTPEMRMSPQALKALGLSVQRAGLRLYALGVDDDERLDMSAAAGADLVAGEAIGAATATPPLVGVLKAPG